MSTLIPLHTHSHYSFLEALPKVHELVKEAVRQKLPAIALTDNGNLHGAIEFYKAAKKSGVQPIIGVELTLAPRSLSEPHEHTARLERIVLLAKNNNGYKNLLKLVTLAHTKGLYADTPRIDRETLGAHANGIIAISPAHKGPVREALSKGSETAAAVLADYRSLVEDFFIEITHHPDIHGHKDVMNELIALSQREKAELIASQEIYYLKEADQEARRVMQRIREGRRSDDGGDTDLSFKDMGSLAKSFSYIQEAVDNTHKIAEMCTLDIPMGAWVFPNITTPHGESYEEALRKAALEGAVARGFDVQDAAVRERLEYELKVIIDKGFAPYFLAVSDLLTEAKARGILTTTRGSAAGSLVSYATGITNIDPLEYNLPFERFLNPDRPKAPDIDMDFADNRRDEIIQYARDKYGEDHVAQIGTFGTMMARAAVRDVARALGHPYGMGDRIAKLIPFGSQGFPMKIAQAKKLEPDLKALYDTDEDVRQIMDLAEKIEGCARHTGVHAAGVVIAPTPLTEWTAIQQDQRGGHLITQYDMHAIEDVGLLKFDFLGIKNLAVLADSVLKAKEVYGVDVDIEHVPVDDKKTFEMLAKGETEGTFQLNGAGMTRYLKELRPSTIDDINAMVALYRPGPMESIPSYIERKRDPSRVTYLDPRMKDILNRSYGVITYQDDVLMIAIELAGYSWGEVDTLRKAMGKKIPAEMEAQREKLIKGAVEKGMSQQKAEALWKLIEPFAGYGFNKAHAASYGRVAYQTAYMKANFPVAYMAALLSGDAGDVDKIAIIVNECKRMGIEVLPPDVNESGGDFTIIDTATIRFGLISIKNFGEGVSRAIIAERTRGGAFVSLEDFLTRLPNEHVNKRAIESLAKCGALDSLAPREQILTSMDSVLLFGKESGEKKEGQDSLFGAAAPSPKLTLTVATPPPLSEVLSWEKELLGMYVSGHPLDAHRELMARAKVTIKDIAEEKRSGTLVLIPAVVEEIKTKLTKTGDKMAFVTLVDKTGTIECVVFPRALKGVENTLSVGSSILMRGSISTRNGEVSLIAEELKVLVNR